jgi:hypothetical protein
MFGIFRRNKKNCTVGASCGATCIDRDNVCNVELGRAAQAALNRKRNKSEFKMIRPEGTILNRIKDTSDIDRVYKGKYVTYNVYGTDEESTFYYLNREIAANLGLMDQKAHNYLKNDWNGKYLEVSWDFRGGDKREYEERTRLKAALEAKKMWEKNVLPLLENGTILANAPVGGPGSVRDRLYRKGGFGRVQADKNLLNQYAIVINGKLEPFEFGRPNDQYFKDKSISRKDRKNWNFMEVQL